MANLKPLGVPHPLRTAGMAGGTNPGMAGVWHEEEEKKEKEKEKGKEKEEEEEGRASVP